MSSNKILFLILFVIFMASPVYAYRIPRPDILQFPLTEDQIKQHNEAHEDLWNLQNGEFNFDIVTTSKTNADNGDFWFIQTGNTVYIQFKANNHIFTISPDGF